MTPLLPFRRSYWVVPGRFLAGYYPADLDPKIQKEKLQGLVDLGCTKVINLMEETEGDHSGHAFKPYADELTALSGAAGRAMQITRFPIQDLGIPGKAGLVSLLDQIDHWLAEGHTLYLHCWGGRGRTGTVVGSWLARHGEPDPLEKLKALTAHERGFFPQIPETAAQCKVVNTWEVGQ
jgi:hypothetical protein